MAYLYNNRRVRLFRAQKNKVVLTHAELTKVGKRIDRWNDILHRKEAKNSSNAELESGILVDIDDCKERLEQLQNKLDVVKEYPEDALDHANIVEKLYLWIHSFLNNVMFMNEIQLKELEESLKHGDYRVNNPVMEYYIKEYQTTKREKIETEKFRLETLYHNLSRSKEENLEIVVNPNPSTEVKQEIGSIIEIKKEEIPPIMPPMIETENVPEEVKDITEIKEENKIIEELTEVKEEDKTKIEVEEDHNIKKDDHYILTEEEENEIAKKKGYTMKKIIIEILIMIAKLTYSSTQEVAFLFMIIAHIGNGNLLSLVYVFSVFCYAIVARCRPKGIYWKIMLIYCAVVIALKYVCVLITEFAVYQSKNDWIDDLQANVHFYYNDSSDGESVCLKWKKEVQCIS